MKQIFAILILFSLSACSVKDESKTGSVSEQVSKNFNGKWFSNCKMTFASTFETVSMVITQSTEQEGFLVWNKLTFNDPACARSNIFSVEQYNYKVESQNEDGSAVLKIKNTQKIPGKILEGVYTLTFKDEKLILTPQSVIIFIKEGQIKPLSEPPTQLYHR